ncbi:MULTISPECIES: plasmid mobilization protein [Staphylococcus]|jgi:KaiC/GvpD/RAD55 family RecA-like ATPase|nr:MULTISPECIES: plasmid mobilization relaxosome protein MobC [Staphylococcus]EAG2325186.1 plasmid mobilization relaxosome protein MobC [Listeria monocytogenes]MBA9941747.1 plasmid mobilization relaxosome protein MobC [Ralstonia insidiosa]PZP91034.1 MAG: plasmid mobilization relaxosome protein MobC [Staphylococcus capitis]EGQ1457516.1 MobC family plasmid mobilization relaxosome protein [Staphylococcus aureus]MBM0829880.1 plasmid mobilization relaxosome protein MobC [Staphylococcus epidermidis]
MSEQSHSLGESEAVGQNRKPNRKDSKQINVRVSESEYSKLKQSAETLNMSLPAFVKKKAKGAKLVAPKLEAKQAQNIVQQLNYLGNNVNQMAKALHTFGDRVEVDEMNDKLEFIQKEMMKIWQQLK